MKNKLVKYLALDTLLALLFVVLYSKRATGMNIHEIVGLSMLFLCVVHVAIHPKYIVNASKKAFSKNSGISGKARFSYFLSLILAIAFIAMIVTAVSISEFVFDNQGTHFMRSLHETLAAVILLLVGVHIGLHFKMIARKLKMNKIVAKIIIAFALVFGVYSLATGDYVRYLTAFSVSDNYQKGEGQGNGQGRRQGYNHGPSGIEASKVGFTFISYGSIVYTFCFATYAVESALSKKKKKKEIK